MKSVILGGLGFIGAKLARKLIRKGHEVLVIDSLTAQIHGQLPAITIPEGVEFIRLDIRSLAQRHDLFEGCDIVYHLAAETGTAQSMYNILEYVDVNEMGTAALLSALANCKMKPKKIVLASSRSVYGEGAYEVDGKPGNAVVPAPRTLEQLKAENWDPVNTTYQKIHAVATKEDCPFNPGSIYAANKASQELLIRASAASLSIDSVILRFQNVYGEGQSLRNPYTGIISIFYNRARQGIEIPIYEDGLESRDFVHVDDVIEALFNSALIDLPWGIALNIGSGKPTSVLDLAGTLLAAADLDVPIVVTGQYRVGDIRHGWADISIAEKMIGFSPKVSLRSGLERFSKWARKEPVHEDKLAQATTELRKRGLAN